MRVGRIPYINCYPVYGAIDRKVVSLDAQLVDGVPTALNHAMAAAISIPVHEDIPSRIRRNYIPFLHSLPPDSIGA